MDKERRQSKRLSDGFGIAYRIYKESGVVGDISNILNISSGGACIIAKHCVDKDDLIELTIRMPSDLDAKITLYGKVLECSAIASAPIYKVRLMFVDIDEQTKKFIEESINILEKKKHET